MSEIACAIDTVESHCRLLIRNKNEVQLAQFVRMLALLLGIFAEVRLDKLLSDNHGLADSQLSQIKESSSTFDTWKKSVELGFRKAYVIPKADLNRQLMLSQRSKFQAINKILDKNLRNIIELRNKLAHGQWVYTLNNDKSAIEQTKMGELNRENLFSLKMKYRLIISISEIIHDLLISKPTFERDFDQHFRTLEQNYDHLITRKYEEYVQVLMKSQEKHKKNKQKIVVE